MRRSALLALLLLLCHPVLLVSGLQTDCPGGVCPMPRTDAVSPVDLFPLDQLPADEGLAAAPDSTCPPGQPCPPPGVAPLGPPQGPTPAPGASFGWRFVPQPPSRSVVVTRYWFTPAMPAVRGYSVLRPMPRRTMLPRWFR